MNRVADTGAGDLEEWRPVAGWEGIYEVSSLGRVSRQAAGRGVRPSDRSDGRRILKTKPANHGYPQVGLSRDGKRINAPVHWLVAEAFIGPRLLTVDHIDGNRLNNRADNLRYLSRSENAREAWVRLGRDHGRLSTAKLTPAEVLEIRRRVASGQSQAEVTKAFGLSSGHCSMIVNGRLWSDFPERTFGVAPIVPRQRQIAPCGTPAGYHTHRRRREVPCESCSGVYRAFMCSYHQENKQRRANRETRKRASIGSSARSNRSAAAASSTY